MPLRPGHPSAAEEKFHVWKKDTAFSIRIMVRHVLLKRDQYLKAREAGGVVRSHPEHLTALYAVIDSVSGPEPSREAIELLSSDEA